MSKEPTIEELQAQLAAEVQKRESAEKIAEDAMAGNDTLQAALTETESQLKAAHKDASNAGAALEIATKKLGEKRTAGPKQLPSVMVDKKKYRFTMLKFSYKGTIYTAEEAKSNSELCAQLVKIGAGCLQEEK